ncbi:MAG: hypothetical protein V1857_02180 [archaeon]
MSAENGRRVDIADIEKEAEAIIEKARRESEKILEEAHRKAEIMLSSVEADTAISNDVMKDAEEKASQIMTESISSTQEQLEELESKAKKNSPQLIQRIVKVVVGTQ